MAVQRGPSGWLAEVGRGWPRLAEAGLSLGQPRASSGAGEECSAPLRLSLGGRCS